MKLSKDRITSLMRDKGMTQNQLAQRIGVKPGTLSNAINNHKGSGWKLLSGLLKVFPQETVASLTTAVKK